MWSRAVELPCGGSGPVSAPLSCAPSLFSPFSGFCKVSCWELIAMILWIQRLSTLRTLECPNCLKPFGSVTCNQGLFSALPPSQDGTQGFVPKRGLSLPRSPAEVLALTVFGVTAMTSGLALMSSQKPSQAPTQSWQLCGQLALTEGIESKPFTPATEATLRTCSVFLHGVSRPDACLSTSPELATSHPFPRPQAWHSFLPFPTQMSVTGM